MTEYRIDREAFREWCERQTDYSRSPTARIIVIDEDTLRFRLREETDDIADVVLMKGRDVDTIRFNRNGDVRQFHAHRREFTFGEKTLIVRDDDGREICRAGTGTKNRRGPFPI